MEKTTPTGTVGDTRRCGFIALIGEPNVGKSTLLNSLVGAKVSIVSSKVQTTRTRVLGIALRDNAQIVFIDTPGIFQPRRRLDRAMVAAAWGGAQDADIVVLLIDAQRGITDQARRIIEGLRANRRQAVAVINKVDLIPRPKLLGLAAELDREHLDGGKLFSDIFMVSAMTGDGVSDMIEALAGRLPEGPWHFPEDQLSDMPDRLLAAEITREQVFHQLHQELPYSATVMTDVWQERDDGSVRIDQTIYVQRTSQRAIVLGQGGSRIKAIGAAARTELEAIFERRVHLFLHVKVRENWIEERQHFSEWGLDYEA